MEALLIGGSYGKQHYVQPANGLLLLIYVLIYLPKSPV